MGSGLHVTFNGMMYVGQEEENSTMAIDEMELEFFESMICASDDIHYQAAESVDCNQIYSIAVYCLLIQNRY